MSFIILKLYVYPCPSLGLSTNSGILPLFKEYLRNGPSYFLYVQIDEKPKMPFLRYSLNNGKMPEFVDSPEGHGYTYIKIIKLMEMHPLVDHSQLQK